MTAGDESQASAARRPRRRKRAILLGISVATVSLLALAAIAGRLWLTDERLRVMLVDELVARTGAPVVVESLSFSLVTGLEAHGVRLGPVPGFQRPLVAADRLAVHWSLWDLIRLRLVLDELALEGAIVTLEENDHGKSLEVLLARLSPGPKKPSEPAQMPKLSELSFPIAFVLERVALTDFTADVLGPGLEAHVDHVNLEGRVAGHGRVLELELWAGLGEPALDGASSHVTIHRTSPPADVDATIRFGVQAVAASLSSIRLVVDLDSRSYVTRPFGLPPLHTAGRFDLGLDLEGGHAKLEACSFTFGEHTSFDAHGSAARILGDDPELSVDVLDARIDLDELAPVIRAVLAGAVAGGKVELHLAPFTTDLASLRRRTAPETTLGLRLEHVLWLTPRLSVEDLDGTFEARTAADSAAFSGQLTMRRADSAGYVARTASVELEGTTPVSPFAGGEAAGDVELTLSFRAAEASAKWGVMHGMDFAMELSAPASLLLARPDHPPLETTMHLTSRAADTPNGGLEGLVMDVKARAWDLVGGVSDSQTTATSRRVWAPMGEERLWLPSMTMALDVLRRLDDYDFRRFELVLPGLVRFGLRGGLGGATSRSPSFRRFAGSVELPQLGALLAVLPESKRPPATVRGSATMELELDGSMPLDRLKELARPPAVTVSPSGEGWAAAVMAYSSFIGRWAAQFTAGMPFVGEGRLHLTGLDFADAKNDVRGLELAAAAGMARHGPYWNLKLGIAEVAHPTPVKQAALAMDFRADRDDVAFTMDGGAATIAQQPLLTPLTDVRFAFATHYRLGGDLVLDTLRFTEVAHGLHLEASGVMAKPFALALERGWEHPGMPGLDVTARFEMGYGVQGEVEPVTATGPALAGAIGVGGVLRVDHGVIGLRGQLSADHFAFVQGSTAIAGMTGGLPFAVQLYGGKRDDAVILARTLPIGGGVVSLIVSEADVRDRPTRPEYYDRLQPYREHAGLAIKTLRQEPYEIEDLRLDGRIESGMLVADSLSLSVLGGDVSGKMAMQLGRDASVRGDMAFQMSGIDASNFKLLSLQPGPDSELNGDFRMGFLFAPKQRDLTMVMNVTRIGAETLDRFLQLLDPQGKDASIQKTRGNLGWIRIENLGVWIRYENLNMDMDYTNKIGIPGTRWGVVNVPRELLRRYSLSGSLDTYLQPSIDLFLAKPLGWTNAN